MNETDAQRAPASVAARVGVAFLALIAVVICGALGWWQWTRSQEKAVTVAPEASVPLADVIKPASQTGLAIGRQVSVSGTWADEDAVLVSGRSVDGQDAVLLVRALTVDADATGTGQTATLAVIVGWRPADSPMAPDDGPTSVDITGYLRAPEEATPASGGEGEAIPGTVWSDTISPSELAQTWPAPLYSVVLSSLRGIPLLGAAAAATTGAASQHPLASLRGGMVGLWWLRGVHCGAVDTRQWAQHQFVRSARCE